MPSMIRSVKVKQLRQDLMKTGFGLDTSFHDWGHVRFPALCVLIGRHQAPEPVKPIDLHVGEKVLPSPVDGVSGAAGNLESVEHFWPNSLVASRVFSFLAPLHPHDERYPFHNGSAQRPEASQACLTVTSVNASHPDAK